jgi:hypothetical protein
MYIHITLANILMIIAIILCLIIGVYCIIRAAGMAWYRSKLEANLEHIRKIITRRRKENE